jgi:hypothetical protein
VNQVQRLISIAGERESVGQKPLILRQRIQVCRALNFDHGISRAIQSQ